jgi:hypothetical protein
MLIIQKYYDIKIMILNYKYYERYYDKYII